MNIKIAINVCRVCLKSGIGTSLYTEPNFVEKFRYSTQIKAIESDGLPSTLCNKCVGRLKIAYDFRKQSESSDRHLRSFINHVNSQFSSVVSRENEDDEEIELLIEEGYDSNLQNDDQEAISMIDNKHNNGVKIEMIDEGNIIAFKQNKIDLFSTNSNGNVIEGEVEQEDFQETIEEDDLEVEELDAEGEADVEGEAEPDGEDNDSIDPLQNKQMEEEQHEIIYIDVPKIDEEHTEKVGGPLRAFYCTKCEKDFSTKTNLMRHMQSHDGVKPYQCTICGNNFTQNGSLKQHMLIHTGERPFKCKICNRGFTQSKSLTFHMRRHTGEKPYTCDKCGLSFRQRDGLKRHENGKHTVTTPTTYICEICTKILHSKYSLAMHVKKHKGYETSYKCELCDKSFSSKASVFNHKRQHTGEKPFKCPTCNKGFAQKGALSAHIKQHLDVKPYMCQLCGRGFIQKHQIVAHMNSHENQPVKKYQCSECYKSFSIKRNLLAHIKNHNIDSSEIYKCDECNIGFNTKRGLKLHRANQHNEAIADLNECEICNIPFVTVNDLNQHILQSHDVINEKCDICDHEFLSKKIFEEHLLEHELTTTL